jgi:hypothetical protein
MERFVGFLGFIAISWEMVSLVRATRSGSNLTLRWLQLESGGTNTLTHSTTLGGSWTAVASPVPALDDRDMGLKQAEPASEPSSGRCGPFLKSDFLAETRHGTTGTLRLPILLVRAWTDS